jgi:hypothetical protein
MNPNHLMVRKALRPTVEPVQATHYSEVNHVSFFPPKLSGLLRLLFMSAVRPLPSGLVGKARVNNLGESLTSLWASH